MHPLVPVRKGTGTKGLDGCHFSTSRWVIWQTMYPSNIKRDEKCVTIDDQLSLLKPVYKAQVHFMHVLFKLA
jgi:hypothetical protein